MQLVGNFATVFATKLVAVTTSLDESEKLHLIKKTHAAQFSFFTPL